MVRGDGSVFDAEISSAQYTTRNGSIRAFMVFRDITDRLRAEREIVALNSDLGERVRLRTAELEPANAELKTFAHSLAHDLRSPIAAIDGFTEMLAINNAANSFPYLYNALGQGNPAAFLRDLICMITL